MKTVILLFLVFACLLSAYGQQDTSNLQLDTMLMELEDKVEEIQLNTIILKESRTEVKKVEKLQKLSAPKYFYSSGNSSAGSAQANYNYSGGIVNNTSNKFNQQNNPAYQRLQDKTGKPAITLDNLEMTKEDFSSGQLTAGELSDFDKYELWQHIAKEDFELYSRLWEINPSNRYSVQVITGEGRPCVDAIVELRTREDRLLWTSRTNNTGSAELWGNGEEGQRIITIVDGKRKTAKHPTQFEEGINRITVQTECNLFDNVDIAFVVDATGSMKDEIKYLQVEMEDIMAKAEQNHPKYNFRTAAVFYRCTGNKYALRHTNFTSDASVTGNFIREQSADEGGAELVDSALYATVEMLNWSENARARIAFLILDEPPGKDSLTKANMAKYIAKASEKGIRIVPVVASANFGTEESLEYLMRSAALLTNSSYVFLTDDSGIGDPHAKPTVDEYEVEKLNKLMIRLINEFTYAPDCNEDLTQNVVPDTVIIKEVINQVVVDSALLAFQDSIRAIKPDTVFTETPDTLQNDPWLYDDIPVVEEIKIWPNPTMGNLTVEVKGEASEVYLADISGKIIAKYPLNENLRVQFDISDNPAGIYMVQCLSKKKWLSGKVVLMK